MIYASLTEFVLQFQNAATNRQEKFLLNIVEEKEVEILKALTGIDVTGFRRIVDNFGVRHAFKKHGSASKESARGQIPIVAIDFEWLLSIHINPGNPTVEMGKKGLLIIRYEIQAEDCLLIYAEEIRVRQRELAFQTLYKRKIRRSV